MILEIDCGNTRAKWRVTGQSVLVHDYEAGFEGSPLAVQLGSGVVAKVRICSVKEHPFLDAVRALCKEQGIELLEAKTVRHSAGVDNSYEDVSRMGVDRWVGMVAAFNRSQGACMLVDAGTALTVDCVDAGGRHRGGLIVPGKRLLLESLNQHTSKVLFPPGEALGPLQLGCSTQEAVYNGAAHMLAGVVHEAHQQFASHQGGKVSVYLAGGDARELMPSLRVELQEWPDIVLDGLQYVVP